MKEEEIMQISNHEKYAAQKVWGRELRAGRHRVVASERERDPSDLTCSSQLVSYCGLVTPCDQEEGLGSEWGVFLSRVVLIELIHFSGRLTCLPRDYCYFPPSPPILRPRALLALSTDPTPTVCSLQT